MAVADSGVVAWIAGLTFGETSAFTRIVPGLSGTSAAYQILQQSAIGRRWSRDAGVAPA